MKSIILPNGLTQRTADCLVRAGVPVTKRAVMKALKDGTLHPNCIPRHYGPVTHKELCRWVGVDPSELLPDSN